MYLIISILFVGILFGYLFRKMKMLQKLSASIRVTICLLLFLLGFSVGGDPEIMRHLPTLGGQALLLAFAGTLGSVLAAWVVYKCFFQKGGLGR